MKCYEYIAVYVDDLCIAAESPSAISQIFKSKYHLKVKGDGKLTYHLGADYFEDPDGTFVSQPRKYIDKLADTTDDQSRVTKQEQANLCAVTVLCAST